MSEKKEVIKQIYDTLLEQFDTYFPGQHSGECESPYIVLKKDGAYDPIVVSSERPIYTIMCYVPKNRYSYLETFVNNVKKQMKSIYPIVMYAGNETSSYYDEEVKGHMISFQYYGCRKIEYMN
jgi:hypothetical protein